jgi:lantibiotic transport system permease protein
MRQLFCSIQIEMLKYKRTYALALAVLSPLFITVLYTIIFYIKGAKIVHPGENGVVSLLDNSMKFTAGFLFPLYLILLAVLIHQVEHKTSSLKDLFSFPVSYFKTYLSKWVITFLLILLSLTLYFLLSLAGTWFVSTKYPDLFNLQVADFMHFAMQILKAFIAGLFMMAIQFLISLKWSDVIVSFGVGIAGFVSAMVLMQGWDYIHYHPYALTFLSDIAVKGSSGIGITHILVYSSVGFIMLFAGGYFVWSRRRIA